MLKKIYYRFFYYLELLSDNFRFLKDFSQFKKTSKRFEIKWKDISPKLKNKTVNTDFDYHYLYHPVWAAQAVRKINPKKHIDVGSTLYFSTQLSAFIPTEFYDLRPAKIKLNNYQSKKADLLKLPFKNCSVESLSCLHTIEHVGLGRYGEEIDYNGDLKAIKELKRVVKINGNLLVVVPVGKKQIIKFNAHRIYETEKFKKYFEDSFKLKEFALICGKINSGIIKKPTKRQVNEEVYGCGCFWFVKK